jgi:hypothetical protein
MRPIKMTEDIALEIARGYLEELRKNELIYDNKIRYSKSLNVVNENAIKVNFTTEAYNKMMALVDGFSSEVAWHGVVERIDETIFRIIDILVYPQTVTGVTVNTDQSEYVKWLYGLPDEVFTNLMFQGHSHVNMETSPSGTDLNDMYELIGNLDDDDYYIFMIWNKRREFDVRVVDMAKNVIYSGADVQVSVEGFNYNNFIRDAKSQIKAQKNKMGIKEK